MSLFNKKKKEVYGEDWVSSAVEAEGDITSVADERLKVAETVSTTLSEEEEEYWAEMTKKRLASEKETRIRIRAAIIIFIIMCISLVALLIWYSHTGGGVFPWRCPFKHCPF